MNDRNREDVKRKIRTENSTKDSSFNFDEDDRRENQSKDPEDDFRY